MKLYTIHYTYNGKGYATDEIQRKESDGEFAQRVLNRIESLTIAGAIITDVISSKYTNTNNN